MLLRDDIAQHGLLCPVELYEGKILDGRHRWRACEELGIECDLIEVDLDGQSPAQYVWNLNGARRHLTAGQRAAVAVELLPVLKEEAKQRQGTRTDLLPNMVKGEPIHSHQKAAEIVGVSKGYVEDAEKIKEEAPDLFEAVKQGTMTIPKAKKQIKKKPAPSGPCCASPIRFSGPLHNEQRGRAARYTRARSRTSTSPQALHFCMVVRPPRDRFSLRLVCGFLVFLNIQTLHESLGWRGQWCGVSISEHPLFCFTTVQQVFATSSAQSRRNTSYPRGTNHRSDLPHIGMASRRR